jgi:hypothetical protein
VSWLPSHTVHNFRLPVSLQLPSARIASSSTNTKFYIGTSFCSARKFVPRKECRPNRRRPFFPTRNDLFFDSAFDEINATKVSNCVSVTSSDEITKNRKNVKDTCHQQERYYQERTYETLKIIQTSLLKNTIKLT